MRVLVSNNVTFTDPSFFFFFSFACDLVNSVSSIMQCLRISLFLALVVAICADAHGHRTKTSLRSHYASRDLAAPNGACSSNALCTGGSQVCSAAVCECTSGYCNRDSTSCAIVQADTLQTGYGYMMLTLLGE